MVKISTGGYDLNRFLSGGYETDIITTIYGPAGCGKTNLCLIASVSQAKKSKKVIFMDTEGGFSTERVKQISGDDYQETLKNILLLQPTSFNEQKKAFESLLKELKNNSVGLIIVDGMTMLYRLEIGDSKDDESAVYSINKELAKQLRTLAEIARNKNIPIIITNQIYYSFQSEEEWRSGKERVVNMVGGDLLKYWSKCLIELKNLQGRRTMFLRKHRSLPEKEMQFVIVNSGIRRKGLF